MKITKKLEFTKEDIKELIAEKYGLDKESATIRVSHYEGDMREASSTTIIVEGKDE